MLMNILILYRPERKFTEESADMAQPDFLMNNLHHKYEAVVIGVSAGGINALDQILPVFKKSFKLPILVVQHILAGPDNYLVDHFDSRCSMQVKEAEDKEQIIPGIIYFAPPGYHLLVEQERTLALSMDAKVNYSRPSIDVLFETAAEAYLHKLVGVVLTGANADGAAGLKAVRTFGGTTIVQSPDSAEVDTMPKAAIANLWVDQILNLDEIADYLVSSSMIEEE